MANVYYLGDLHFGHKNILTYRSNFSSIEEHDTIIMENILTTVGKRDTLWLMGDILFNEESISKLQVINSNVGYVNWVLGNHDSDNNERQKIIRKVLQLGIVHKVGALFSSNGFWLSHAPIHSEELRGKCNIHGHVHTATLSDNRYFNTSCENINYKPVDLNFIKESTLKE